MDCSFFFCCLMFLFFAKGNNTIEWLIAARCVHATTQSILKIHQPASGFVRRRLQVVGNGEMLEVSTKFRNLRQLKIY